MASSPNLLNKNKGQVFLEHLLFLMFTLGTLASLSVLEKVTKKETHKYRLNKKNNKYFKKVKYRNY